ncbi:unnamed protein product [Schistosoma curassoni]|uniref:Reverse transcriptase domain-containing protein n=1 Tax=Schistosoma curassoni TaxID=6186 RepID=A0A183L3S5_9TREM|nr:unnamed protein product [Schistosoma curassoni]
MQLDDLELAGDLALLSHTHEQMQIKTASVAAVSAIVGLNIHKGKTKVLKYNTENTRPTTLDDENLEDAESFTYLGSIIDEQGGSDADVKMNQLQSVMNKQFENLLKQSNEQREFLIQEHEKTLKDLQNKNESTFKELEINKSFVIELESKMELQVS